MLLRSLMFIGLVVVVTADETVEFELAPRTFNPINVPQLWEAFKNRFDKTYANASDEFYRYSVFYNKLKMVAENNRLYDLGQADNQYGINAYSDLTFEEFEKMYLSSYTPTDREAIPEDNTPVNLTGLPATVDWNAKGYVNRPMQQGHCDDCWAFSTTALLEGAVKKKHGKLPKLSEQQLLDCARKTCNAGWSVESACNYIKGNGGLDTEQAYPYVGSNGKVGSCHYNAGSSGVKVVGFSRLPSRNEARLQQAVADAPVSVCVYATSAMQNFHGSGIFQDSSCSRGNCNHAVTAVGYGNGYWYIKNSWGTSWGSGGFFKMPRGSNYCHVADDSVTATVV